MRIPIIKEIIQKLKYTNGEFLNKNNLLQKKAEDASDNFF